MMNRRTLLIGLCILLVLVSGCADGMYNNPKKVMECSNQDNFTSCMECCIDLGGLPFSSESRYKNCKEECS